MLSKQDVLESDKYWVKCPWTTGQWLLFIKPKSWHYPVGQLLVQVYNHNYIINKKVKKSNFGFILNAEVNPSCRRKGIATLMLKEVTDWLDVVQTGSKNNIASSCLLRFGFKFDKKIKQFIYSKKE